MAAPAPESPFKTTVTLGQFDNVGSRANRVPAASLAPQFAPCTEAPGREGS